MTSYLAPTCRPPRPVFHFLLLGSKTSTSTKQRIRAIERSLDAIDNDTAGEAKSGLHVTGDQMYGMTRELEAGRCLLWYGCAPDPVWVYACRSRALPWRIVHDAFACATNTPCTGYLRRRLRLYARYGLPARSAHPTLKPVSPTASGSHDVFRDTAALKLFLVRTHSANVHG
ncbi:hypothetical protein VTO73DRAFT_12291 [Trametes versicolor]